MRRLDSIKELRRFAAFTSREEQVRHLRDDLYLYSGKDQVLYICSLLGTLFEELADRPELQELVLEATWMARAMHDLGVPQPKLDWLKANDYAASGRRPWEENEHG